MNLHVSMVTFDAMDPSELAEWWACALGGRVVSAADSSFIQVELPQGLHLGFQKVTEPTPGKNRLHLDLADPDPEDRLKQLQAMGADVLRRHEMPDFAWVVLADPEGNQFCLATAPPA
ncbi:MAG: VOC family protein [Bifidobacteriaceae bacterium]|jgi:predicted enzyme related to lactoylglutathione lyase|nr:VOC family protein [Bifidobacteriaceae bacterium]